MHGTMVTFIIIVASLLEIFWFIQLLHLMSRKDETFAGKYDKPCWVAVLLAANWIGALAYVFLKPFNTISLSESLYMEKIKPRGFTQMPDAPKKCPKCGTSTFYNAQSCLSCGWSYDDFNNKKSSNGSS